LPAISPYPYHVAKTGLISYGADVVDQYRLGAGYVDRILRGEKPADLPVQAPTKYDAVCGAPATAFANTIAAADHLVATPSPLDRI